MYALMHIQFVTNQGATIRGKMSMDYPITGSNGRGQLPIRVSLKVMIVV